MSALSLLSRIVAGLLLSGLLAACEGPSAIYDKPESNFNYPNSNVIPLGHVTAEVTQTSIMFPAVGNPNLEQEAVRKALSKKMGASILIDGRYFWTSTYTDIVVPIYTTTLVVDGEAAQVELGVQERVSTDTAP